jgi:uncharacterized protein (DUF1015 family)
VSREEVITRAMALMRDRPLYVADGHHRYETACLYLEHLEREHGPLPPNHPARFVLTLTVGMNDPGLLVLPTHRLFRNVPSIDSAILTRNLGPAFECSNVGSGTVDAEKAWAEVLATGNPSAIAFYTASDQKWTLAEINESGVSNLRDAIPDLSDDWRSLGVAILHELILNRLLEWTDLSPPKYVHSIDEVRHFLISGDDSGRDATGQTGSGSPFPLAALVQSATVEDIRMVSSHGERMPAKSTFFYPKVLSGLIFNPLE